MIDKFDSGGLLDGLKQSITRETQGSLIRQAREDRDPPLSQRALADEIGVTASLINKAEANRLVISKVVTERICRVLDIQFSILWNAVLNLRQEQANSKIEKIRAVSSNKLLSDGELEGSPSDIRDLVQALEDDAEFRLCCFQVKEVLSDKRYKKVVTKMLRAFCEEIH